MLYNPLKEKRLSPIDQAIDAIIDLLERTWVGYHPGGPNENCPVTAVFEVEGSDSPRLMRIRLAMDREAQARGFDRVDAWNDAPGRTKAEVTPFMEAVRRRCEP